jgi:hypothetical protein
MVSRVGLIPETITRRFESGSPLCLGTSQTPRRRIPSEKAHGGRRTDCGALDPTPPGVLAVRRAVYAGLV